MDEEEVDPLDAYMSGIVDEVKKLVTVERATVMADKTKGTVSRPENGSNQQVVAATVTPKTVISSKLGERFYADDEDQDWESASDEDFDSILKKEKKKKELPTVDHSKVQYMPFRKKFYIEVPEIKKMTKEEVDQYRKDVLEDLKVRGKHCPKPVKEFAQCGLSSKVFSVMKKWGYDKPTPIQAQAIPAIMSGRDIIG